MVLERQLLDRDGLQAYLRARIAPAGPLGLEVIGVDPLTIAAPLAANLNDKGTAFAGSLFSVAALAGWAHLTRWCVARASEAEIVLQAANAQFLAPARAPFRATVREPAQAAREKLTSMLERRGRGRIELAVDVSCDATAVMTLAGIYAVTLIGAAGDAAGRRLG